MPTNSHPRPPRGGLPRAMHHCQDLDPIREDDIIDQVSELLQPRRSYILPHQTVHFRHRCDAVKLPPASGLRTEPPGRLATSPTRPRSPGCLHRPQAAGSRVMTGALPNRAKPSRHGLPSLGEASASARRLASSAKCHSGNSSGLMCSGRLSQICSINSSRSRTLSRSIPNTSRLTVMAVSPGWSVPADRIPRPADSGKDGVAEDGRRGVQG